MLLIRLFFKLNFNIFFVYLVWHTSFSVSPGLGFFFTILNFLLIIFSKVFKIFRTEYPLPTPQLNHMIFYFFLSPYTLQGEF
mgnify:CR=1 FL=1